MTRAEKEFEEWEALDSSYFGDADEAVDHRSDPRSGDEGRGEKAPMRLLS
jgi:hypothetical protein